MVVASVLYCSLANIFVVQRVTVSMDVDPNHTTNKQKDDDDGELSMETDEFPFPTSQSVDDTFREATLIATLAESFSLTHFKAFQKDVITCNNTRGT